MQDMFLESGLEKVNRYVRKSRERLREAQIDS